MKMKILLTIVYIVFLIGYLLSLKITLLGILILSFILTYTAFMMHNRIKKHYKWYNDLPNTMRLVLVFLAGLFLYLFKDIFLSLSFYIFSIILNDEFQRKVFRLIVSSKKGLIIAFLGLDGAGKTTHISALKKELSQMGYDVIVIRYQNYLFVDKLSRIFNKKKQPTHEYIKQKFVSSGTIKALARVFLSALDNLLMFFLVVIPNYLSGKIVLCDRFPWSTYVRYVIMGYPAHAFKRLFLIIKPHLIVYLDIPAQVSFLRIRERLNRGEIHINYSLSQLAYEEKIYKKLIKNKPVIMIDTQQDYETTHKLLLNTILKVLSRLNIKS